MLPEFPSLVLCKKCEQFYWVKDARKVEEINDYGDIDKKWGKINYIEFPTFNEYFKALETISEERFLRMNMWWSFNDYYRNGNENEITPVMQNLNTENLILLSTLLNESDENDLLMKAEVFRNLGRFEESRQLLDKVESPDLIEVKEKLLAEINNKNYRVFRLY
jgi:hypothetical protein